MHGVEILALTPARLNDLFVFFEQRAFADHPQWRSCYCHFPHADHVHIEWHSRSAQDNRAATGARVQAGTMQGWLAYADGAVVGWCNAGARVWTAALFDEPEPLAEHIGSIACFVIAPGHRRQGIASALLARACEGLAAQGFAWAEAYPRSATVDDGANHFGPLAMYRRAGFETVRAEGDDGLVLRKRLLAPDKKCEAGR